MSGRSILSDVQISKTLSFLLRHGAVKEKLPITSEGFINVATLLQHRQLRGCTVDDIQRIVANNDKQRFALRTSDNILEIRANQGHSVKHVDSLELTPIIQANQVKHVIHGTFYKNWAKIKHEGLNRMNRNHIHFAEGLPRDEVISGMRHSCEVYIYLNIHSLLAAGLTLFRSANGVILSAGNNNGVIEPKYFLKVVDSTSGKNLL